MLTDALRTMINNSFKVFQKNNVLIVFFLFFIKVVSKFS